MENFKWFYEAQSNAGKELSKRYGEYTCNFQEVCKNRVYLEYTIWDNGKPYLVHVTVYKGVKDRAHYTIFTTEPTMREIEAEGKLSN